MQSSTANLNSSNSPSLSWSSLSGAKQKFSESVDPLSDRKKELNVIEEGSNENSESSSKKGVLLDEGDSKAAGDSNGRSSSVWWSWNQNTNEINYDKDNQQLNSNGGWSDWNSYSRVGSVVSYMYSRNSDMDRKEQLQQPNDISGLASNGQSDEGTGADVQSEGTLAEDFVNGTNGSWFSWLWFSKNKPDNDTDEENASDLYKSAKLTIENSKDTSYYAFKALKSNKRVSDIELAVSNTLTEIQPVKYSSKRRPLTPNEIQEMSLKSQPLNGAVNSPGSSINSDTTLLQNYIIPNMDDIYRTITWKTKARLLGEHILYKENTSEKHIYRSTEAKINYKREKAIKKVVIVGVHSFLPIKLVKALIGDSTGNSIKYVNEATAALKEWFIQNTYDESAINIETIALEGEGRIEERVSKLYKLIVNWLQCINDCDFLFFVSHSQGSLVAIHLLAELLTKHSGLKKKKIGLLSMAGMMYGPIAGLDSKLVVRAFTPVENEIISELFELQKPNSLLSTKLNKSMAVLMECGVKVSLGGSLNDQLVPIYSSLAVGYSHPNIHRFLYVHHKCDLPSFLISLLRIAVIMKNMGRIEYNLLRELSDHCVGPVSEGAHCKIYRDKQVYVTAIRHTLETTKLTHHHQLKVNAVATGKTVPNLYSLPWSVRSLIHELTQTKNICNAKLAFQLIQDFKQWVPAQKQWKELKYCFEALDDANIEDFVL